MGRNETTTRSDRVAAAPNVAERFCVGAAAAVDVSPVDDVIIVSDSSSTSTTTSTQQQQQQQQHYAATAAGAAAAYSVVVVVDGRRRRPPPPPPPPPPPMGMDEASWHLIQRLQAQDAQHGDGDDDDDDDNHCSSSSSSSSVEIVGPNGPSPPRRYKKDDDDDDNNTNNNSFSSSGGGSVEIIEPPPPPTTTTATMTRPLHLWDLSFMSLRQRLEQCGVSTDHMVEKDELVTALETAQAAGLVQRQSSAAAGSACASAAAAGSGSGNINLNKNSFGEKRKRGQNPRRGGRSKMEFDDELMARQLQREENDKYLGGPKGFYPDDEVVARKIQRDEDEHQLRLQEEQRSLGLATAWTLQQEEDYNNRKNPRHRQPSKDQVLKSLESCQLAAVDYVKTKAKAMHDAAVPALENRVLRLGFTVEDLEECLVYIQDDAPIVIHLKAATLSLLVQDTHYRNQFETNTSGGTNDPPRRATWERAMFGPCYDGMDGACRPKYGCLNVSGDIAGVKSARQTYGPLVLTLQAHTRYRSTFFNKDTGRVFDKACGETLATNEYYAHVLNGYNDAELTAVIHVCQSARVGGAASNCNEYKEVQIHGPVCLTTDVQALSIPGRARDVTRAFLKDIEEFQKKTGCTILWQQDILDPEDE